MSFDRIRPEFVTCVPAELDDGVLYVSIPFRTSMHLCACGCRNKVVMPIRPGAWHLTYDGETVSMSPSVGNHRFPCRSHYWIRNNVVRWAPTLPPGDVPAAARPSNAVRHPVRSAQHAERPMFGSRLLRRLRRLVRR